MKKEKRELTDAGSNWLLFDPTYTTRTEARRKPRSQRDNGMCIEKQ
jgi:hypothetical protein